MISPENVNVNNAKTEKEEITFHIAQRYTSFGAHVDVDSQNWKRFRKEVYELNQICAKLDQTMFDMARQKYKGLKFSGDDISRTSADSSIFLPQLGPNNHKIMQRSDNHARGGGSGSFTNPTYLTKSRKPVQFGGV